MERKIVFLPGLPGGLPEGAKHSQLVRKPGNPIYSIHSISQTKSDESHCKPHESHFWFCCQMFGWECLLMDLDLDLVGGLLYELGIHRIKYHHIAMTPVIYNCIQLRTSTSRHIFWVNYKNSA